MNSVHTIPGSHLTSTRNSTFAFKSDSMDLVQVPAPLDCHVPSPLSTLPFSKPDHTADFQEDACLVPEKANTPSQKISGAVTTAYIKRCSTQTASGPQESYHNAKGNDSRLLNAIGSYAMASFWRGRLKQGRTWAYIYAHWESDNSSAE